VVVYLGRGSVQVVQADPFFRFPAPSRDQGRGHGGRTDRGGDGPADDGFLVMRSQAGVIVRERAA
jgi:hypothetical protein